MNDDQSIKKQNFQNKKSMRNSHNQTVKKNVSVPKESESSTKSCREKNKAKTERPSQSIINNTNKNKILENIYL